MVSSSDLPGADGRIDRDEHGVRFRYERELRHPVELVWRAITDPDASAEWTGNRPELDLRPGGTYTTYHQAPDGSQRHVVVDRILRLEPPHVVAHTFWEQVNPDAVVTWELSELPPPDGGCRLVLTHALSHRDLRSAAESVAGGDSVATILSRNAAGWHHLLDLLTTRLDGREVADAWSAADQEELRARYAATLPR